METEVGKIDTNLERADELIRAAFAQDAEWVILPEFFSTGMAFHPAMDTVVQPIDGSAGSLLCDAAREHGGYVGGSFICERDGDAYNTFVLAGPDGSRWTHNKDQPTMWEGCYYTSGSDDGLFEVDELRVGAAVCWELIRWRTVRRLRGKVDILVGGSAWWSYPTKGVGSRLLRTRDRRSEAIGRGCPGVIARLLGVPVVHASQAGRVVGRTPYLHTPYPARYVTETQICDGTGRIVAQRAATEGAGVVLAEVQPGPGGPIEELPDTGKSLWIPDLPLELRLAWWVLNRHARRYYERVHRKR